MKKLVMAAIVAILLITQTVAFAAQPFDDSNNGNVTSYVLLDMETGQVLHQKNQDERIYPASTTKLMTALLLLEQKGFDGEVTVGEEVNKFNAATSSLMGLVQNETIPVEDLLFGLMVPSGNDAAAAIAVYVSGSVEQFAALMNERASQLGMTGTYFRNPHGLAPEYENETHYSTAADMALLAFEAAKHPEILDAGSRTTYTVAPTNLVEKERVLKNTNFLLSVPPEREEELEQYLYSYANGLKTGLSQNMMLFAETPEEEYVQWNGCLVATAEKDGFSLMAVIMGDSSEKARDRWGLAKNLFEYGFTNYAKVDLSAYIEPIQIEEQLPADGDYIATLAAKTPNMANLPGKSLLDKSLADGLADGSVKVEAAVNLNASLTAPIAAGEEVGTVSYMLDGAEIYSSPLVASIDVLSADGQTKNEQGETGEGETAEGSSLWFLWILIPALVIGAMLIIRAVNLSKRRYRRGSYGGRHRGGAGGRGRRL